MSEVTMRRPLARFSGLLALVGIAVAVLASAAPRAEAITYSSYCGNQVLGNHENCFGAQRNLFTVYGWGDQHSVCVWAVIQPGGSPVGQYKCSSGPGVGVEAWQGSTAWLYPAIGNNAAGSNTVHGVAYQP